MLRVASLGDFCPCANVTEYICTNPDSTAWGVWCSLSLLGNKLQNTVHQTLSTNAILCWVLYPNSKHAWQRTLKKKPTTTKSGSLSKALAEQGQGPEFRSPARKLAWQHAPVTQRWGRGEVGAGLAGPLARLLYLSRSGLFHVTQWFTVRSISMQMSQIQGLSVLFLIWQNKIVLYTKRRFV